MKIYIAGAHSDRARLKEISLLVAACGHEITSRWLDEDHSHRAAGTWSGDAERDSATAMRDHEDVRRANGVLLDTLAPSTTGGYDTEWGIALDRATRMRVVVGPFRNGFQIYGAQRRFDTWEECLAWLKQA